MSLKKTRALLEHFAKVAAQDPIGRDAREALVEVDAVEKAAREYFTWSVSPESRGVLTAISQESGQ